MGAAPGNPNDMLSQNGYQQYHTGAGPDESGKFGPVGNTTINTAGQQGASNGQAQLAAQLQNQANGQGASLANNQLMAGTQQNLQTQLAAAAAQRGNQNVGGGLQALASNAAASGQNAALQSADVRAQEQMNAQQGLAGVLGQQRGQDIGLALNQAQMNQQNSQFNAQAQQNLAAQQVQQNQYQNSANMSEQDQQNAAINGMTQTQYQNETQQQFGNQLSSIAGGLVNTAAGAAAMMSDQEAKTNIADAGHDMTSFLDHLRSSENFSVNTLGAGNMAQPVSQQQAQPYAPVVTPPAQSTPAGGASGPDSPAGDLPRYGNGGIVNRPTVALIGEKGPEAVVPLSGGVKDDKFDPQQFLGALTAHSYKYKDPSQDGAAPGEHFSPMAQELEKAGAVGKSMVEQGPDGYKHVDYGRGLGALFAAAADMHGRIKKLEGEE